MVTGARLPHEVRRHVHVAAEAVGVDQARAGVAYWWRVERAARRSVRQVREQEGEAHLPKANEAGHAIRCGATVGAVRSWFLAVRTGRVEYLGAAAARDAHLVHSHVRIRPHERWHPRLADHRKRSADAERDGGGERQRERTQEAATREQLRLCDDGWRVARPLRGQSRRRSRPHRRTAGTAFGSSSRCEGALTHEAQL